VAPVPGIANLIYSAAPPPPPFYLNAPPPPRPSWISLFPPSFQELQSVELTNFTGKAQWDRIRFDPVGQRLFLGLQANGLVVVPLTKPGQPSVAAARTVPGTTGANGMVIANSLGFAGDAAGFTGACTPGGVLSTGCVRGQGVVVVNLTTLQPTAFSPVRVAGGVGVDNGVFDAARNRVIMTLVNGSVIVLDASSGVLLGTHNIVTVACAPAEVCDPLEYPTLDSQGSIPATNLYMSVPDQNAIARVRLSDWSVTHIDVSAFNCFDPTGLSIDMAHNHLFVGCGDFTHPMLLVLNLAAQPPAPVARIPIGRGNDGVFYDSVAKAVYASAGAVGTISVVQQSSDPSPLYALREVVFTKVGARTMAVDTSGPYVYTMTSDGRYDPSYPSPSDQSGGVFAANWFSINNLDLIVYGPSSANQALAPPPPF
jgi:hypothetical protein